MSVKAKPLGFWFLLPLLTVVSLAAASDLRLVDAVEHRDKEAVRSLLNQHVDVNARQADGATALHWAAHWDDLEAADLLMRAGAKVNAANDYGVTPLSLACTNGSAAMVEKLLKAGADPNAALPTGETVLMTCAHAGNVDAVKSLLAHEAHVNAAETWRGQTALMRAVAEKHPEVVRALVEHGADIHARSKGGFTPLLFAAREGDVDSARILLEAGADVNEAAPDGKSVLLVASESGHEALSVFLLEKGANPNAADANGVTALHWAVLKGIVSINGIRTFTRATSYLFRPNMPKLVDALLAHGANPNARLAKSPQLGGKNDNGPIGATPFLLAAATGDISIMRVLAAQGADPRLATKAGLTPLMVAAGVGLSHDRSEGEKRTALEGVKLALEMGNDINAADQNGWTALHGAAYLGDDAIVQFLVDKGAKLNAKDRIGQTPWSIAEAVVLPGVPRDLLPQVLRKSTAELLLKLGATRIAAPVAQRSDVPPVNPKSTQ